MPWLSHAILSCGDPPHLQRTQRLQCRGRAPQVGTRALSCPDPTRPRPSRFRLGLSQETCPASRSSTLTLTRGDLVCSEPIGWTHQLLGATGERADSLDLNRLTDLEMSRAVTTSLWPRRNRCPWGSLGSDWTAYATQETAAGAGCGGWKAYSVANSLGVELQPKMVGHWRHCSDQYT